jgi:hypothetical protein
MGKRKKIKLSDQQKIRLKNLQWYTFNKICWVGPVENVYFNEVVLDGRYAVFTVNSESAWDCFDSVICSDSLNGARCIEDWNPSSICRTIDLDTLMTIRELRRPHIPHFNTMVERLEDNKLLIRYMELKKYFRATLKYFK